MLSIRRKPPFSPTEYAQEGSFLIMSKNRKARCMRLRGVEAILMFGGAMCVPTLDSNGGVMGRPETMCPCRNDLGPLWPNFWTFKL